MSNTTSHQKMSNGFKKNDLYIYDLPDIVINSLELMKFDYDMLEVVNVNLKPTVKVERKTIAAKSCNTCKIESFEDDNDRRSHFKTDHHRFNIKRLINGLDPVTSDEFFKLTENDDVQSVSGSESESECPDVDTNIYQKDEDELSVILRNELEQFHLQEKETGPASHLNTKSPFIYMKSKQLTENEVFGIYKAMFNKNTIESPISTIAQWKKQDNSRSFSVLLMVGGGHFAGAVVSHQRIPITGNAKKPGISFQEQGVHFIEQKTFHRYTTRRKQGGSQSASDNAKGKANSAGSTLRRYNEAALKTDIQSILKLWEPYISKCENIFIRAKSVSDKKIFLDDTTCISKTDPRLKTFPFTTMRPTSNELKRAWCQLTYLSINEKPQPKLKTESATTTDVKRESAKNSATPEPMIKEKSEEEKHTENVIAYLQKSKAPLLISYLKKNKLDVNFELKPESEYQSTPTMLHFSSQNGLKHMVLILLSNLKSDPTIKNKFGKTAWDLARRDEIRENFQLARYKLGEEYTNWELSHIGEPLSNEAIEEQHKKQTELEQKEAHELIRKELDVAKQKLKDEKDNKRGIGKQLGSAIANNSINLNSLSDDQRMRLMREQRARAAEARQLQNSKR